VENELLTPTLKLKRADAARAFRNEIDRLYEEINATHVGQKSKL
jgi:long-chain acyl-CoA synthetase